MLAALRGYPLVINKWASWCGPCRIEFPFFQKIARKYGKRVAFVGIDAKDSSVDDLAKRLDISPDELHSTNAS